MISSVDQQMIIRHDLRPGDLGRVTALRSRLYAQIHLDSAVAVV